MTTQEFRKIKKQIEKLLQKAEDEALLEGVDISSDKFQTIFKELKRKILANKGISLEEYDRMEDEMEYEKETKVDKYSLIKLGKGLEKEVKEDKEKFDKTIKELQENFSVKLDKLTKEADNKITVLRENTEAEKEKIVVKMSNELTNQQKLSDIKLNRMRMESAERFKEKEREIKEAKENYYKIVDDQSYYKEELNKRLKKLEKPKILKSFFGKEKKPLDDKAIKKLVKEEYEARNKNMFFRPVRGLNKATQKELTAFKAGFADAETPSGTIDGSNTAFTLANVPNPVTSLAVFINSTRKTLTEDYTLSGATLTLLSAPRSGAILRVDYRF